MGHIVTGLVGTEPLLQKFAAQESLHQPIPLKFGLAILPLSDENIEALSPAPRDDYLAGFNSLSSKLVSALCRASNEGTIMYFETEYFGGAGTQGAAVFSAGGILMEPESADIGPVNRGLALLGVHTQPPAVDEFVTIGLARHRSVDSWLNDNKG